MTNLRGRVRIEDARDAPGSAARVPGVREASPGATIGRTPRVLRSDRSSVAGAAVSIR